MQPLRMISTGFEAAGLRVPPFELRAGESLCLHMPPSLPPFDEHDALVRLLTGYAVVDGLRVPGQSEWAKPAVALDRWVSTARPPERAADWLVAAARLPRDDAVRRLRSHGLPGEALSRNLTPFEWRLMGLELAWARGAEVTVYDLGDLEPGLVGQFHRAVWLRIQQCAALRLHRPVMVEGQPHWRACWPMGRCLKAEEIT